MIISKDAGVDGALELNPQELAQINAWSRRELKAEEVYAFAVKLCDNEVDRDWERFPAATLEELAPLFAGKSGLFDHQWSAREQTARIYRTEVVREARLTGAGEPYCYLKGYAYLLRTEGNRELIAEIEGGIKKEVSVGCAVERAVCSICGQDIHTCPHEKGEEYGGQQCWADLVGATDAYEWSFVAVPAQKNAGVMKHWRLEQEAALGRKYLEGLRRRGSAGRPGRAGAGARHPQGHRGQTGIPRADRPAEGPGEAGRPEVPGGDPADLRRSTERDGTERRGIFDLNRKGTGV